MENNTVQLLASLLNADRRWTAREVAAEDGVCHKTVVQGGQQGTSTKMDALMIYDAFQTFGKNQGRLH